MNSPEIVTSLALLNWEATNLAGWWLRLSAEIEQKEKASVSRGLQVNGKERMDSKKENGVRVSGCV